MADGPMPISESESQKKTKDWMGQVGVHLGTLSLHFPLG